MCVYSAAKWHVIGSYSVADYLMATTGVTTHFLGTYRKIF
jgi:hypothetical protein